MFVENLNPTSGDRKKSEIFGFKDLSLSIENFAKESNDKRVEGKQHDIKLILSCDLVLEMK